MMKPLNSLIGVILLIGLAVSGVVALTYLFSGRKEKSDETPFSYTADESGNGKKNESPEPDEIRSEEKVAVSP